jgi:hypothetical protein
MSDDRDDVGPDLSALAGLAVLPQDELTRLRERVAKLEAAYTEALSLYGKVRDKHAEVAFDQDEERYWQGKKDGVRLALALLAPDLEDRERWKRIQESTPTYSDFDAVILGERP